MIYYWYNFILHFYTCMDRPHTSWPHIGIVDMADPRPRASLGLSAEISRHHWANFSMECPVSTQMER